MITIYNPCHPSALFSMFDLGFSDSNLKILLVPYSPEYEGYYLEMIRNGLFNQLVYYDYNRSKNLHDESKIKKEIDLYFRQIFKENGIDESEIVEAYTCSDAINNFFIYLYGTNIRVNLIELASLQFEYAPRLCTPMVSGASKEFADLQIKSGFFDGRSNCHSRYLCKYSSKKYPYDICKDFFKSIKNNDDLKIKIIKSYKIPEDTDYFNQIVMMNSGLLGKVTKLIEQDSVSLYQLIIDYFGISGQIYIKVHPNDSKKYTKRTFVDGQYLGRLPMETYGLLNNFSIGTSISLATQANSKLLESGTSINNNLVFPKIFDYYEFIPDIFVIMDLLSKLDGPQIFQEYFDDIIIKNNYESKSLGRVLIISIFECEKIDVDQYDYVIIIPNGLKCRVDQSLVAKGYIIYGLNIEHLRFTEYSNWHDHTNEILLLSKKNLSGLLSVYSYSKKCNNTKIVVEYKGFIEISGSNLITVNYPNTDVSNVPLNHNRYKYCIRDSIEYQMDMADRCLKGMDVERSISDAIMWARLAATDGSPRAVLIFFKSLIIGGNEENYKEAFNLLMNNISSFNEVYYLLAELMYYGHYIEKDDVKVMELLRKGINLNIQWDYMDSYTYLYSDEIRNRYKELKQLYLEMFKESDIIKDYILSDLEIVKYSKHFDKDWYLSEYPEVLQLKMLPEAHYLNYGWKKGYDPSPDFSTKGHMEKETKECPLVEFEKSNAE